MTKVLAIQIINNWHLITNHLKIHSENKLNLP